MSLKMKIAKISGVMEVPGSWQFIGDIALAKFSTSPAKKKKIAAAVISILKNVKTVCEIKEIGGEFREPVISVLAGSGTATIHKENDVLYKIDIAKVMFSKGNLTERKRLLPQIKESDTDDERDKGGLGKTAVKSAVAGQFFQIIEAVDVVDGYPDKVDD